LDDGAGRGVRQRHRGGAPGGAGPFAKGSCVFARRTNGPLVRVRKGPRKPLAPPGAPSSRKRGKENGKRASPGPEQQTTGAGERWLNRLFEKSNLFGESVRRDASGTRASPSPGG
jgi:hypothetical protein